MTINGKYVSLNDKDEAIRLHRQMWNDMAEAEKKRGRKFAYYERSDFKARWVHSKGYTDVANNCFLCEYAIAMAQKNDEIVSYCFPKCCKYCPLEWTKLIDDLNNYSEDPDRFGRCTQRLEDKPSGFYRESWLVAPIEDIASLPEKSDLTIISPKRRLIPWVKCSCRKKRSSRLFLEPDLTS